MSQKQPKCDRLWKKRRFRGTSGLFIEWPRTNDINVDNLNDHDLKIYTEAKVLLENFKQGTLPISVYIDDNFHDDYPEDNLFPCFLKKNLDLRRSQDNLGRSVYASNDIPFAQKVFKEKPFASVVEPSQQIFCLTCHRVPPPNGVIGTSGFITCSLQGECGAVFCDIYCRDSNQTHKFECGTYFRNITDLEIACTIQMVFETMTAFVSAEELLVHIENLVKDEITYGIEQRIDVIRMQIPQRANDKKSNFDCIMRLQNGEPSSLRCYRVDIAIELMESINSIQAYFQTSAQKRLLRHLAQHFFGILLENAWKFRLICGPNPQDALERRMIYPVGSYFNHSCAPDLLVTNEGNVMFLRSLYQIPAGEEVFVSYEFFYDDDTDSRQRHLKASWGFECACTRCNGHDVLENDRRIAKQVFDGANRRRRPNEMVNLSSLETKLRRIGNPRNGGMDLAYLLEYYNNY